MPVRRIDFDADRSHIESLIASSDHPTGLSEEAEWDLSEGAGVAGLIALDGGVPLAYVHLRRGGRTMEPIFAPGLAEDVVAQLMNEAISGLGDGVAEVWTSVDSAAGVAMAAGFVENRRVVCLQRPLPAQQPPALPEGVRPVGFRRGIDEGALLLVHNEAFAGHPDIGGWRRSDLDRRMRLPWFDPAGLLVAWDRGRPVAVCWTKASPPGVGEIYLIAVRPESAGQGLGKALALRGLEHLGAGGAEVGRVFTDSDNVAAHASSMNAMMTGTCLIPSATMHVQNMPGNCT